MVHARQNVANQLPHVEAIKVKVLCFAFFVLRQETSPLVLSMDYVAYVKNSQELCLAPSALYTDWASMFPDEVTHCNRAAPFFFA